MQTYPEETVYIISIDPNGCKHVRCQNIDSAVEYVLTEMFTLVKTDREWAIWFEEKEDELWAHWEPEEADEFEYSEYDLLFNPKEYPNRPRTFVELREWLRNRKPMYVLWSDRCTTYVRCMSRQEFMANMYDSSDDEHFQGDEHHPDIETVC